MYIAGTSPINVCCMHQNALLGEMGISQMIGDDFHTQCDAKVAISWPLRMAFHTHTPKKGPPTGGGVGGGVKWSFRVVDGGTLGPTGGR